MSKLRLFTLLSLLAISCVAISASHLNCQCPTTPLRNETGQFFGSLISCCDGGHPQCKHRGFGTKSNINGLNDTQLFCYHDVACVTRSHYRNDLHGCEDSTCYVGQLQTYRVSNALGAVSMYKCQHVHELIALNTSVCLLKGCTSFSASVLKCECSSIVGSNHCTCHTSNDASYYHRPLRVQRAVFFTFKDVFTDGSKKKKNMSSTIFLSCFGAAMIALFLLLLYRVIKYDRYRSSLRWLQSNSDRSTESENSKPPSFSSVVHTDQSADGLPSYEEAVHGPRPNNNNAAAVERY